MSGDILAAELVGAQQHGPGGAAHLVLLAGVALAALVFLGASRWRRRRDAAAAAELEPASHERSEENTRPTEEE